MRTTIRRKLRSACAAGLLVSAAVLAVVAVPSSPQAGYAVTAEGAASGELQPNDTHWG
ncbi:hypothetical protein [Streptomyces peucetius]